MSAEQKQLRSVNCTQCAAPLKLYGGRQVKSLNCGYCGAVLDTREEFKVVQKFKNVSRPFCPISLGMQGRIKGVNFTVIGMIQYSSVDSRWINLFLFSPTHGYAWLEYENGHFVFSRMVRDKPSGFNKNLIKSTFKVRGKTFKVFDSYNATVSFVEGELTWVAKVGDKVNITDGIVPPYVFSVEQTGKELEYSFGEYISPDVIYRAFKIKSKPERRKEVHAAQPYLANNIVSSLSKTGIVYMPILAIACLIVLLFGRGETILSTTLSADQFLKGVQTKEFTVTKPNKLMGLYLQSDLSNAWAFYDITISNEHQELYSLAKQIPYYHGYEGGESWSEGSRSVKAYFKLPEAGKYNLYIHGEGGTGNRGKKAQNRSLSVRVAQGVVVSRYLLGMLIFTFLATVLLYYRKYAFERSRWGEDEDD